MESKDFKPYPWVVYVAGPITKGDKGANVRQALAAANQLVAHGVAPIVPHLSVYWDLSMPPGVDNHDVWLPIDFAYILRCDAVLRLPGESRGADLEAEFASERGIMVFYRIDSLLEYLTARTWLERRDYND